MSEKERSLVEQCMEKCGETVPRMSELEKEKFLSYMEGVAFITAMQQQTPAPEQPR